MSEQTLSNTNYVGPGTPIENTPIGRPRSALEAFLKQSGIPNAKPFGSPGEANNTFRKAITRLNMDIIKQLGDDYTSMTNDSVEGFIRTARKKLHQGKPWSRKFIHAILEDYWDAVSTQKKAAQEATKNTPVEGLTNVPESFVTNTVVAS